MAMNNSDIKEYVEKEVSKIKGLYIPINSSFLERTITKHAKLSDIHPNIDDEFCFPDVGPSYRIIGDYQSEFNRMISIGQDPPPMEPLVVMKAYPNGYILVNGHHRWGAALKIGLNKVPIKIVNLMLEKDIKRVLEKSDHDKRVTLDLDEVVFRSTNDANIEKTPLGIMIKMIPQRIRLGIPALFRFLKANGYDIWVYSSNYYSYDDIRMLFRRYSVHVDGIITSMGKKGLYETKEAKDVKSLIVNKYLETIHIDNKLMIVTNRDSEAFEEYELNPSDENWSKDIINILEEKAKKDKNSQLR